MNVWIVAFSWSVSLASCAPRVVVDGDSDPGVGGAGGSGGGGKAQGSASQGGGGAEPVVDACTDWCARKKADGCDTSIGSCYPDCVVDIGGLGICRDDYAAMLECQAHQGFDAKTCAASSACDTLVDDVVGCAYPAGPCGETKCPSKPANPFVCCEDVRRHRLRDVVRRHQRAARRVHLPRRRPRRRHLRRTMARDRLLRAVLRRQRARLT